MVIVAQADLIKQAIVLLVGYNFRMECWIETEKNSTAIDFSATPVVVDLFCGVGGLTHGFLMEGLEVAAGIDTDETCRWPYTVNNEGVVFLSKDIRTLSGEDILHYKIDGRPFVLVGCAPCQPFSRLSHPCRDAAMADGKWALLADFIRLVKETLPDVVSMENVPDLCKHKVFAHFVDELKKSGYSVWFNSVNCVDYGIPQTRTRLVLLASLHGKIEALSPASDSSNIDVKSVIGDLPPLAAGSCNLNDPLHTASALSEKNLQRIRSSKPGGSWRRDWSDNLLPECYKKRSGKSFGSVYGRMSWDAPAPTMTTQFNGIGNGRFGHPEQDRAISFREAALFQTFPRHYQFVEPKKPMNYTVVARHIGNAVPVKLGSVIARSIKEHLKGFCNVT